MMAGRWVLQRRGQPEEALERLEDGSGWLTRTGETVRGRWKELPGLLRFVATSGDCYDGSVGADAQLVHGLITRTGRVLGRFTAFPDTPPPPLAALTAPPALPPALAALPRSVHYVPQFLSADDEAAVLRHVRAVPAARWSAGAHGRRTLNFGGRPSEQGESEALPEWAASLCLALMQSGCWAGEPPNHVLVNEYASGAGLDPHTDGPLYAARVATLSLGSDVVLDLHRVPKEGGLRPGAAWGEGGGGAGEREAEGDVDGCPPFAQLLLRRRSLHVMCDDAYSHCWHGITARKHDVVGPLVANLQHEDERGETVPRGPRVSIVFVHKFAAPA
ncbi:hypothetical protein AB1Y20_008383 [Prymnesium parvum]|uniref:Fe2OG dioxygenase domain-containing protein n=1 Tax=Prymnesium parvum TaxID=97485 RepID=A0AB34ITE7_PRYPA